MTTMNTNANVTVKSVLWFSRHTMTDDQLSDLKRIFGEDIIVHQVSASATSFRDVLEAGKDDDVLAVVLPPAMLADLTNPRNNQKPVIRAIANRVPTGQMVVNPATGREEEQFKFEHAGWERVIKIEVVTEKL